MISSTEIKKELFCKHSLFSVVLKMPFEYLTFPANFLSHAWKKFVLKTIFSIGYCRIGDSRNRVQKYLEQNSCCIVALRQILWTLSLAFQVGHNPDSMGVMARESESEGLVKIFFTSNRSFVMQIVSVSSEVALPVHLCVGHWFFEIIPL